MLKTKTPKHRRFFRKSIVKYILPAIILAMLIVFSKSCYFVKQAAGQLNIRLSQIPLEEAIEQEENADYKMLLMEIPSIVKFGTDKMHLKKSDNYTDYYKNEKRGISFVVTAAPKLKLESHYWWYPIVGKLPFQGYFNEEDAIAFAQKTEEEGMDVYMFAAPAYSTLGWFKDPVTTNMLRNGKLKLADSILHEMVHATYFVKDEGDYNESLASFVGSAGAEQYALKYFPNGREMIDQRKSGKESYKTFTEYIEKIKKKLNELYRSGLSDNEKLTRREDIFKEAAQGILDIYPNSSESFRKINNARLMQISRYRENNPLFRDVWEETAHDWSAFWSDIRSNSKQYVERFNSSN